ncbi:hypothetical protein DV737_g5172, partial [Chaetothyriales sp. CBS 132003]
MLANLFSGSSKTVTNLESKTEEDHSRSLLWPPHLGDPTRSLSLSPSSTAVATPTFRPGGYDDRGGLELNESKDVRIIIAQDAFGSLDRPLAAASSSPIPSPLHSPRKSQAYQFNTHQRNRSTTFSGTTSPWARPARDVESHDKVNRLLDCMFGVTSATKSESSTKMHVLLAGQEQPLSHSQSSLSLAQHQFPARAPVIRSNTSNQISAMQKSLRMTRDDESVSEDVVLVTRMFTATLSESKEALPKAPKASPKTPDGTTQVDETSPGKRAKLIEKKVPMYAVAIMVQLPPDEAKKSGSRPVSRTSPLSTSFPNSQGSEVASSWTLLETIPDSLSSSTHSQKSADRRIEYITNTWDVMLRSLSHLEAAACVEIERMLHEVNMQFLTSVTKTPKGPHEQRTNQRNIYLRSGFAQEDMQKMLKIVRQTQRRICLALRIPKAVTGAGFLGGHWLDEARYLVQLCAVKAQDKFLYSLLSAFLDTHIEWLENMGFDCFRKQGHMHCRPSANSIALASRTVIIADRRSLARRLIFLLASFLPSARGINAFENANDNLKSPLHNPNLSPLYSRNPETRQVGAKDITPPTSMPFISGKRTGYFDEEAIDEGSDINASVGLQNILRRDSSSFAPSSTSSTWGTLFGGLWTRKHEDSHTSASSPTAAEESDLRRTPGEDDVLDLTPHEASSIEPPRLRVNEDDGVVDVDVGIPGFLGWDRDDGPMSPSKLPGGASSLRSLDGAASLHSSVSHGLSRGEPAQPDDPNVAGYLKRYHEDFALQAVAYYDDLPKEIMDSMSRQPKPLPVNHLWSSDNGIPVVNAKIWVHDDKFSTDDVLINEAILEGSGIREGDLIEIISSNPGTDDTPFQQAGDGSQGRPEAPSLSRYLCLAKFAQAEFKAKQVSLQVSIKANIAAVFGFQNGAQIQLSPANLDERTASHVEFTFRDTYLARSDIWRLVGQELAGKTIYVGQRITFLGSIKLAIKSIHVSGHRASTAFFSGITVPIFRSEAARYAIFIQMSREMWDFDSEGNGEILFSRVINGFLPDLFKRWTELEVRHLVSIILFGRHEYRRFDFAPRRDTLDSAIQSSSVSSASPAAFQDFYKTVVTDMASAQWTTILNELKRDFRVFLRDVSLHPPKNPQAAVGYNQEQDEAHIKITGRLSAAMKGNILEAINLGITQFSDNDEDRDLIRTGVSIVVITAGTGVFEVDRELLKLTSENLTNNGMAIDIVCLSRMPLHSVPLFKYRTPPGNHSSLDDSASSVKYGTHPTNQVGLESSGSDSENSAPDDADLATTGSSLPNSVPKSRLPFVRNVNASNPLKYNPNKEAYFGRWQHLYPRKPRSAQVKWRSLCTPACVPLTTEDFPSEEALEDEYEHWSYIISVSSSSELTEKAGYRDELYRELLSLRFARGYQLAVGPRANKFEGLGINDHSFFFNPDIVRTDGQFVFMTMGNTIQKLTLVDDRNIKVTLYEKKQIDSFPKEPEYRLYMRTIMSPEFKEQVVPLKLFTENYPWEQTDRYLASPKKETQDDVQTLRLWRARFVLLPVPPPEGAFRPTAKDSEENEEEIHLRGIRALTKMWQKSRYLLSEERRQVNSRVSSFKKKDGNPLRINMETLNPSELVATELDKLVAAEDASDVQIARLLPEDEQFERESAALGKLAAAIQGERGIEIKNRRWHLRLHYSCFVGEEFTNWLVLNFRDVDTRDEAIDLGNELMKEGLFEHVNGRHNFKDGNFFYSIKAEWRVQRGDMRQSWFNTTSRKSDRTGNLAPLTEQQPRDSSLGSRSRSGTNLTSFLHQSACESKASSQHTPTSKRLSISLSKAIRLDVDPRRKSNRPEIVTLHYDRLHNPENCYHLELSWLNATSKLVDDAIVAWTTQAEKYGLKLVEVPITEVSKIPVREPFRAAVRVRLAEPPPFKAINEKGGNGNIYLTATSFAPHSSSTSDKHFYHKQLLKHFDFVLDIESVSEFPSNVDITYSWGKRSYQYTQFIHRTGIALAQISDEGEILRVTAEVFGSKKARSDAGFASYLTPERICEELHSFCSDRDKLLAFYNQGINSVLIASFFTTTVVIIQAT